MLKRLFEDVRVAVRLPVVVAVALVALVVYALVAMNTVAQVQIGSAADEQIQAHSDLVAEIVSPAAHLMPIELAALRLQVETDPAIRASIESEMEVMVARFHERLDYWQDHEHVDDEALRSALGEAQASATRFLDVLEGELLPAIHGGADTTVVADIELRLEHEYEIYSDAIDRASVRGEELVQEDVDAATDLVSNRATLLWSLLGLTLVVVGAAAIAVTRSIVRPLGELQTNMEEIASGSSTAEDARLDADRGDEFGRVAEAFNAFADRLVAYADEVEASAAVAQERARLVSEAASSASENMNTVAAATTELSAAASEIARSAGDASATADTAVHAAEHANALMAELVESSEQIGAVVESIRSIAAQTTMLALNATIEAARAGEAGRGFAVVASEVKDLAAETGSAASDIVGRVDAIRTSTQAAVAALAQVSGVITEIHSSQAVIAAAVEEQAATTSEIDRSLTQAVTAVNQLAESDSRYTTAA